MAEPRKSLSTKIIEKFPLIGSVLVILVVMLTCATTPYYTLLKYILCIIVIALYGAHALSRAENKKYAFGDVPINFVIILLVLVYMVGLVVTGMFFK